jgi:hypothetical protein
MYQFTTLIPLNYRNSSRVHNNTYYVNHNVDRVYLTLIFTKLKTVSLQGNCSVYINSFLFLFPFFLCPIKRELGLNSTTYTHGNHFSSMITDSPSSVHPL